MKDLTTTEAILAWTTNEDTETAAYLARAVRIAEAYDNWCLIRDTDRKIDGTDLLFDLIKKLGMVE